MPSPHRHLLALMLAFVPMACDDGGGDSGDSGDSGDGDSGATVTVSGDAFNFGIDRGRVEGATITILEMPDESTTTDADGHFTFDLPAGAEATFVFDKDGFPRTYTKTFTLPPEGETLERITFQVPTDAIFNLMASVAMIEPDPGACQIASTVTRVGKSLYDEGAHGEDGATVTIEPSLPAEHGPIYFNANVFPDSDLTETSQDGGILYTNVPAGSYHIAAEKDGVEFEAVDVICDPGVLVNPSPPFGLQAL